MLIRLFGTPLYAAFFCILALAGCKPDQSDTNMGSASCPARTTAIARVQGSSTNSPLLGEQVTIRGIVTLLQNQQGLYIEESESDADARTSNALFVEVDYLPKGVNTGSMISVTGTVSEIGQGRYTLTAISDVDELIDCKTSRELPLTEVVLPLNGPGREALEGMRIAITDALTVTDSYQFRRGNITLSGNGMQFAPTETIAPGKGAADRLAQNRKFTLAVRLAEDADRSTLLTNGSTIENFIGVMAHDGYDLRVSIQSMSAAPLPGVSTPDRVSTDNLRITGMNLHNYFNGDGKGRGFPTPRGAETAEEFTQQRNRIGAALKVLDPHIVAVMELENDGFGGNSAAQDLINLANDSTGKPWAVARPVADNTGDDAITVGLFYRSDRVSAIGPAQTLQGPEFTSSRQPMAQVFQASTDDEKVLVVVNHLKSKGSCPDSGENADQEDGQGCWNPMREASAEKMSAWANRLAAAEGISNVLILGDLNAYRREDPIEAVRRAGYTELMDSQKAPYSFVYYGQHGTLDYAFASAALQNKVDRAFIWNVNSVYPANMPLPEPWLRFSDHDPVVVDLRLRHSTTSD